jgi:hypothetical protein
MEPLVIGFTGRREGLTDLQLETLEILLKDFVKAHHVLCMHNDGQGADQVFAQMAKRLGAAVGVTPGNMGHMARNRYLIEATSLLLACPPTDQILKKGSGSWETIKYMWKKPGDVIVVLSDGSTKRTKAEFTESKKE